MISCLFAKPIMYFIRWTNDGYLDQVALIANVLQISHFVTKTDFRYHCIFFKVSKSVLVTKTARNLYRLCQITGPQLIYVVQICLHKKTKQTKIIHMIEVFT